MKALTVTTQAITTSPPIVEAKIVSIKWGKSKPKKMTPSLDRIVSDQAMKWHSYDSVRKALGL